jgi:glycogen debranching enzyme
MQASPAGITILEGARFLVADGIGNVSGGLEGFYADDTRQLSRWRMTLDGRVPMLLASGTSDYASATIYLRHDSGTPSRPSEIGAIRRLFTSAGALHERLTLENYGSRPCEVVVGYEFDADFLDIFEVKSQSYGERDLAFAKSITPLHTSRWYNDGDGSFRFAASGAGFEASSLVAFDQEGVPGDREMHFEVQLAGRATWSLSAQLTVLQPAEQRPQPERFTESFQDARARVASSHRRWLRNAPTVETTLERLPGAYRTSLGDLAALRMLAPGSDTAEMVPAAGLPWFMTVFGRDTLLTSLQIMPLGDELARAALRVLAAAQATADDASRDAEPGKILHEMRFGKVAALTGQFPYYGSVDSTLLFLILLSEVWRWTGDAEFVRELEQPARRAIRWLEESADLDGDGFVEFRRRAPRGLEVQCWKDSWDSMRFQDGRIAEGPLAVAEVQGYAYDARLRSAEIARAVWNDGALATRLEADAAELRRSFDEAFWLERDGIGYYALALDGEKRQVDALSSNAGHLLFTGIADASRREPLVETLMSDRLFTGWAIRSLSSDGGGYNPIGYHTGSAWPHDTSIIAYGLGREGFAREALLLVTALLETAEHFGGRLPEAIAGYARAYTDFPVLYPTACSPQAWAAGATILSLRTMLGLEPDVQEKTLSVRPTIPHGARLLLDHVPAFGGRWRIEVDGDRHAVERVA